MNPWRRGFSSKITFWNYFALNIPYIFLNFEDNNKYLLTDHNGPLVWTCTDYFLFFSNFHNTVWKITSLQIKSLSDDKMLIFTYKEDYGEDVAS